MRTTWSEIWQKIRGTELYIIGTVCLGLFIDAFVYSMVIPSMFDTLTNRAHVPEGQVQMWTMILLASFGLALLAGSLLLAWLSDRFKSYRRLLLIGVLVVTGATVMFLTANNPYLLAVARAGQGLASALIGVIGLAFMSEALPTYRRDAALGYAGVVVVWGSILGPVLGGVLYEVGGYIPLYVIPFFLLAVDFALRVTCRDESNTRRDERELKPLSAFARYFSAYGAARYRSTESLGVLKRRVAPSSEPFNGPTPLSTPAANDKGAIRRKFEGQESQVYHKTFRHPRGTSNQSAPMVMQSSQELRRGPYPKQRPLSSEDIVKQLGNWGVWKAFFSWRMMTANLLVVLNCMVLSSFDASLPVYVKIQYGWHETQAGLVFLAFCGPGLFSPLVVKWIDRAGSKTVATVGIFIIGGALLPFRWLLKDIVSINVANAPTSQPIILISLLVIIGFGSAFFQMVGMTETSQVIAALERNEGGINRSGHSLGLTRAFAMTNIAFAFGEALGPVFARTVIEAFGFTSMNTVLGGVVLAALIPTVLCIGEWNCKALRASLANQSQPSWEELLLQGEESLPQRRRTEWQISPLRIRERPADEDLEMGKLRHMNSSRYRRALGDSDSKSTGREDMSYQYANSDGTQRSDASKSNYGMLRKRRRLYGSIADMDWDAPMPQRTHRRAASDIVNKGGFNPSRGPRLRSE